MEYHFQHDFNDSYIGLAVSICGKRWGAEKRGPLVVVGKGLRGKEDFRPDFRKSLVMHHCNWLSSREPSVSACLDQCAIL